MIIWQRNKDLKINRAVRSEKILIVLDWLLEFRASNVQILAKRLGISIANCHTLLSAMKAENLITSFENLHTRGLRLFSITRLGFQRLETWGRSEELSVHSPHHLSRSTTILHDLCVQRIAIELMDRYQCSEVHWDQNIKLDADQRPDLLLVRADGYRAAVEFDRTPKTPMCFYERLVSNYESIAKGHYHAAIIACESEAILDRYQALFSVAEWPIFRKNSAGKLTKLSSALIPLPEIRREITWLPARDLISDVFSGRQRPEKSSLEAPTLLELQPT